MPGDPGGEEDVVHTGRVVVRQVVERGDDTVVDHLLRAADLAVGITLAVTHVGLELGVAVPAPPRLLKAATAAQSVLHFRVRGEGPGQRLIMPTFTAGADPPPDCAERRRR